MLEMRSLDSGRCHENNLKATHTPRKQLLRHTRYKTKWRAKYERHHETRVKVTHTRNVQLEGHTLCENNLKATHATETNLKMTQARNTT